MLTSSSHFYLTQWLVVISYDFWFNTLWIHADSDPTQNKPIIEEDRWFSLLFSAGELSFTPRLKIGPMSSYPLYLILKLSGWVKIELKDVIFQNFLKYPWLSIRKKKKKKKLTFHFLILFFPLSHHSSYLSLMY